MKKLGTWLCLLLLVLALLPLQVFAEEATVEIPVQIQSEGGQVNREEYIVELKPDTPGAPMPADNTGSTWQMQLKPGEPGYIRIPCVKLGAFDYTIRQVPGEMEACTYDQSVFRLRLLVTQGEDGKKTVNALLYGQSEEKQASILFQNRWAQPAFVTFSAWKTMDGETPEDGAFVFRLLSEDGELLHEVKNDGRRVRFPKILFDKSGTFRFFLKEVAGNNRKILYDRSVYTITVTVTKDGDYQASVGYERNGKPWTGIPSFANYTDTGSPKTGDTIGLWVVLLGLSALALAVLLTFRRKKQ